MNFIDQLAYRVWENPRFHHDLTTLESSNFLKGLKTGQSQMNQVVIDTDLIKRTLQVASIFSLTDDQSLRSVAQRISTAALNLVGPGDLAASSVYAIIQSRLSNFPALTLDDKGRAPELAPFSIQLDFVRHRAEQTVIVGGGPHVLTQFQRDSWWLLKSGRSGTLTGPTSAGKSFVVQLYIADGFARGVLKSVVYIVPTRALINQVSDEISLELEKRQVHGVQVVSVPVDMGDDDGQKTLYVFTQERLETLLVSHPDKRFDLVVVDEAQIISEGARGVLLELVLDRIRDSKGQRAQVMFLGPMIQNPEYFAGVLEGQEGFSSSSTEQSPVTQRLIYLDYSSQPKSVVAASVGSSEVEAKLEFDLPLRLLTDLDKISYLSYFFGRNGSSIVYANGKANAEKIAIKIADFVNVPPKGSSVLKSQGDELVKVSPKSTESEIEDEQIRDLIKFVKKHVHPEYALVSTLKKRVGFHYGHMPSLLRKELERCFKDRRIDYLACTSTLLYGMNLPARNIFLHKPQTGRGSPISGPSFWNLAGRVGRLGKEREGDIYLIDYREWSSAPVSEKRGVHVTSALKDAVVQNTDSFAAFIDEDERPSGVDEVHEIALGKLVVDARQGQLDRTLDRYRTDKNSDRIDGIRSRIEAVSERLVIPTKVLDRNVGVSPFRQQDLLNYMDQRLKSLPPEELIPAHPLGEFSEVLANHQRAFKRIHTHLLRYPGKDKRHFFFASLSLRWMRGDSLPQLISSAISWHKKNAASKSTATIIREVMEQVEDDLRFKYVKYFSAYNSVLEVALVRAGLSEHATVIPDIPLYLEMGGSSGSMINFMALGLSRSSAEELSVYTTDKEMAVPDLRLWLQRQELSSFDLSPAVVREVEQLLQERTE